MSTDSRTLQEESAPAEAGNCERCPLALQRTRLIWGEGRPGAPILIVLDNPGAREDPAGRPFLCGTRITLLEAVAAAGLDAEDLYVTYILKCRPRRTYDRPAAWRACLPWLAGQVNNGRPRVLVGLGNNVLRALAGETEAEVKEMRGRILHWLGFPLVVGYHPLAARRRPSLFSSLVADLRAAASFI